MAASAYYIGNTLAVFIAWFTPLQVLAVVARFYARRLTARPRGLDDFLILASLLGQFVAAGIAIGSLKQGGVGYHIEWVEENNPQLATIFLKYLVAISAWYYVTINLSKLAICIFYRTLFPSRSIFFILCLTAAVLIGDSIASLIADLAACNPFEAQWASTEIQNEKCINKEALYVWSTFPNIVTDVVLLVLPIPIIWRLHTSKKLKVALTATFVFGSIGLIASILRFLAFDRTSSFTDPTYNAVELMIWTVAEPGIYLIAACLMTYRPLLDRIGSKIKTHNRTSPWPSKPSVQSGPAESGDLHINHLKLVNQISGSTSKDHNVNTSRGILLSSMGGVRGHGFEQLPDAEEYPGQDHPLYQPSSPKAAIVRTTDIHMSWNNV